MKQISTKQKEINKAYSQQRRRIQRFIRSASKRGYRFEFEIPKIPKKKTMGSVRRLQKITPESLYAKAIFIDYDTGEIVSGKQGRTIENQKRSQKSAKTRSIKIQQAKFQQALENEDVERDIDESENVSKNARKQEQKKELEEVSPEDKQEEVSVESRTKKKKEKKSDEKYSDVSWDDTIINNFIARVNDCAVILETHNHFNYGFILIDGIEKLTQDYGKHDVAMMLENGQKAGLMVTPKVIYEEATATEFMTSMLDYLDEAGAMYKSEFEEAMSEWEYIGEYD